MKDNLISMFQLVFIEETKWNTIYENETHVFIFNKFTQEIKIKIKV